MRVCTTVAALAVTALLSGCGTAAPPAEQGVAGSTEETKTTQAAPRNSAKRRPVESRCKATKAPGFRVCEYVRKRDGRSVRATIERKKGNSWLIITREPRGAFRGGKEWGAWVTARLSPDRRTLLAEWMSECDMHHSFLVDAGGGAPRVVTGGRNWRAAPPSLPQEWSADGRARVLVLSGGGCSAASRVGPGQYLVSPDGQDLAYVGPLPPPYGS